MLRVALLLTGLLGILHLGKPAQATPEALPTFSGYGEIEGPISLTLTVTPPVSQPREQLTLALVVTNSHPQAAVPEVILALPPTLLPSTERMPAATTFNYKENSYSWQPVVAASGGTQALSLTMTVSVADLQQPEQTIAVSLRDGNNVQRTTVSFWSGLAPTAAIAIDPPVAAVGEAVQLVAHPGGTGPFTQVWDLGDGRHVSATDPVVVFPAPGIYEIRLQLANPLAMATAISAVTIVPQPVADFEADDLLPTVAQPVNFENRSAGEPPISYSWDFGDGTTSQEASPVHQFMETGTYEVRLQVDSQFGSAEKTIPVTVGVAPVADFVIPERVETGTVFEGQAFSDDSVIELAWDMGDGRTYTGETISHNYQRTGEFAVTLVARNATGETVVTHAIVVSSGTFAYYIPFLWGLPGTSTPGEQPAMTEQVAVAPPLQPQSQGGAGVIEGGNELVPLVLPPQTPLAENASPAERLFWYINEARRLHGLPPLAYSYPLSIAAQEHTGDMALNADVMHIGSDGSHPADRQRRFGYDAVYGGEAVAWGWENAVPVVEFWVNSPPHRALILNPEASEVGVGFTADGTAPNLWYWAAEFGIRPSSAP